MHVSALYSQVQGVIAGPIRLLVTLLKSSLRNVEEDLHRRGVDDILGLGGVVRQMMVHHPAPHP
jgi:hypothetical protein